MGVRRAPVEWNMIMIVTTAVTVYFLTHVLSKS